MLSENKLLNHGDLASGERSNDIDWYVNSLFWTQANHHTLLPIPIMI